MKTIFTTIFTLSLVIFAATTGISNPVNDYTGDNLKKNNNKAAAVNKAETVSDYVVAELSYLRFDVNEYLNENAETELPVNVFNYLRFDVNNYVESNASETMEMPVSNELNYLRFDVNYFVSENSSELDEMPVNDLDYLRFDVNKYANTTKGVIDELPIIE
jgi:hypothetical protein